MMMTTHALMGAALGRLIRNRPLAFLAGIASHAVGDVIPHRDYPLEVDAPLAAAVMGVLTWRFGIDSPEVAGAVGGMAPDGEHLPTRLGWIDQTDEVFPTHGPHPQKWLHSQGRIPNDNWSQIGLAAASLLILAAQGEKSPVDSAAE